MCVLLDLLEKFERCLGLKNNCTKSEAMWLGKWKDREDTPFNVKWPRDSVFALGIHFSNSEKVSEKLLWKIGCFGKDLKQLEETETNSIRQLKINIVKSVGLSKLIYNVSVLPVPKNFCDQVNKVTFNFIWDNKMAKVKKKNNYWRTQKRGPKYDRFYVNDQSFQVQLDKAISPERELGMDGYSQWSHITLERLNLPLNL